MADRTFYKSTVVGPKPLSELADAINADIEAVGEEEYTGPTDLDLNPTISFQMAGIADTAQGSALIVYYNAPEEEVGP